MSWYPLDKMMSHGLSVAIFVKVKVENMYIKHTFKLLVWMSNQMDILRVKMKNQTPFLLMTLMIMRLVSPLLLLLLASSISKTLSSYLALNWVDLMVKNMCYLLRGFFKSRGVNYVHLCKPRYSNCWVNKVLT